MGIVKTSDAPEWASRLGIVAVLFGILAAAGHANEWMKLAIVGTPPYSIATMPEPDCEPDELEEEGLSLEECRQLALAVHDISISSPRWFKSFHMTVSAAGMFLGLASIVVGIALVDYRPWAAPAAVQVFAALTLLDVVSFTGVVNSGPLIRQMYLWNVLLWASLHLALAVAAFVGLRHERAGTRPAAT